jgi:hypothetical protein
VNNWGLSPRREQAEPEEVSTKSAKPVLEGRSLVLLAFVFVVTRTIGAFLAGHPSSYTGSIPPVIFDAQGYGAWASEVFRLGRVPYAQIRIEYPPGALPFILAPAVMFVLGQRYLLGFIALMVFMDALGLVGLVLLARRWGSPVGPWLWVLTVPLLGPVSWVRLDMAAAVTTIWVIAAASTCRWGGAGGLLALGGMMKVYPAFLLPAAWRIAPRRRAFILGAVLVTASLMLPFAGALHAMFTSVASYHLGRGIQAESLWANALYLAHRLAHYPLSVVFEFGSDHVSSAVSPTLKQISTVLSLLALVPGFLWAARGATGRRAHALAVIMFVTVSLLLVTGRVLSPQYLLWLIALGSAVACAPEQPLRGPVLLLIPAAMITQVLYPFLINVLPPPGAPPVYTSWPVVAVMSVRNTLLLAIAGWSLALAFRHFASSPRNRGSQGRVASNEPISRRSMQVRPP